MFPSMISGSFFICRIKQFLVVFLFRRFWHVRFKNVSGTQVCYACVPPLQIDMQRKVDNKERGASRKEGVMSTSTRDRYRITIRDFTNFLEDKNTSLVDITPATIAKYKVVRHKAVIAKKQSRGGAGVALDIAVLHGMFAFALAQKMLFEKPISMARESKPGENP